jgi:hypothetical protein
MSNSNLTVTLIEQSAEQINAYHVFHVCYILFSQLIFSSMLSIMVATTYVHTTLSCDYKTKR